MSALPDPRAARAFRFVRASYASGVASLSYAFDDGVELVERVTFPGAPAIPAGSERAFAAALRLLHLVAGVSYYKAGVPREIVVKGEPLDEATATLLDAIYTHGLGEFAYQNRLALDMRFPRSGVGASAPPTGIPDASADREGRRARIGATPGGVTVGGAEAPTARPGPRRTLVPLGGGKDSLVSVELLRDAGEDLTVAWVGNSELIRACAERTGLPALNVGRELSPVLFEMNRAGAYNGHIPVTAINSAILVCAALLTGHDAIAFSNERSASAPTLEAEGVAVNHQWSKGLDFERMFGAYVARAIDPALSYYSLLRPLSELAVTQRFAKLARYHRCFSSCNRNFRILGQRPASRWCGVCPKCHFVFLALAPFLSKAKLVPIFGRNLLDDESLAPGFDALVEWHAHKPFECVGEARESRAAFAALAARADWREDALVARFAREILPHVDRASLALEPLLEASDEHRVPPDLAARVGFPPSSLRSDSRSTAGVVPA